MYYYISPNLYGYMYYPNNYYYGYTPYYPVYSNCKSCKNNVGYFGTHDKHNLRNENVASNQSQEVELIEQKFIPKQFSISYPFIPKNQPIIESQPPMQGMGGSGNQVPPRPPMTPGGPGNQVPPRPPMTPGGQGNQVPPGPPMTPMGSGGQVPPRPPMTPGGPGNQVPPRPPVAGPGQGGQMGMPNNQGSQVVPRGQGFPGGSVIQGGQSNIGLNSSREQNDQDREEIINNLNQAIIDKVSELFKTQVLVPEKIDFTEVYGTFETTLNKNGIVSILFDMFTYVEMAAHGLSVFDSITFNANTGQIYTFADLFNPRTNYIAELNRLAQEYIKDNNVNLISPYGGVDENQAFYLTPDSLVMYYQVYRYTPYYYGLFRIEIPYSKITNLLGPVSPINKLI